MSSLKEKFLDAESFLAQSKIQMPESIKLKLYGLTKQIKEGDCKMQQPPSSNTILRAKWESWTSFSGMPIEKAMNEFLTIVDSLRDGSDGGKSGDAPGSIRKAGTLYKQRDVFKGWRPRHFVLQDSFLHYYLDAEDPVPRNTMDLTGCSVTTIKSAIVEGVEYFPFVITHPKSTKTYNLASITKLETDIWVAKILEAAAAPASAPVPRGKVERLLQQRSPDTRQDDDSVLEDVTANKDLINSVLTLANIPKKFSAKLELAMKAMLDAVAPDATGWEPLFEKNGISAYKRSGDVICVRGDSVLTYNITDVFEVIMNVSRQLEIDPQQRVHEVIQKFSNHTWAEYIGFKGIWPTSPRDFTNLIHWRQMTDGTIIIAGFSDKFEDIRPLENGNIRGELILGGYVLRPHPQGTQAHFVVQTDLKGTLPTAAVNIVSSGQPMILYNIRRLLNQDKAKKDAVTRKISAPATYQELLALSQKGSGQVSKGGDVVEIFGDPSNSAPGGTHALKASTIDRSKVPAPAAPVSSTAAARKSSPKKKPTHESKLNAIALLILFLPPLLFYAVDRKFRALAFIGGLVIAYRYLVRLHLGEPRRKAALNSDATTLPVGRMNYRFPVDLGKLLRFLDVKRDESELEITLTHVAVKATALALADLPTLKGHVIFGNFYPVRQPNVDLSVSYEVSEKETVVLKITDADAKPLEMITDEINTRGTTIRKSGKSKEPPTLRSQILGALPSGISSDLEKFFIFLGAQFGASIPLLGIERFPLGVCTVLTSPNQEGESDMDIMVVPNAVEGAATPITVTIGGIRLLPSMDSERRLAGAPVLNFTVSIDSKAGSLAEGRKFSAKLQQYLNDPDLIEKADGQAARQREDASKRKSMFG